jgi:hypothetical protein
MPDSSRFEAKTDFRTKVGRSEAGGLRRSPARSVKRQRIAAILCARKGKTENGRIVCDRQPRNAVRFRADMNLESERRL